MVAVFVDQQQSMKALSIILNFNNYKHVWYAYVYYCSGLCSVLLHVYFMYGVLLLSRVLYACAIEFWTACSAVLCWNCDSLLWVILFSCPVVPGRHGRYLSLDSLLHYNWR